MKRSSLRWPKSQGIVSQYERSNHSYPYLNFTSTISEGCWPAVLRVLQTYDNHGITEEGECRFCNFRNKAFSAFVINPSMHLAFSAGCQSNVKSQNFPETVRIITWMSIYSSKTCCGTFQNAVSVTEFQITQLHRRPSGDSPHPIARQPIMLGNELNQGNLY